MDIANYGYKYNKIENTTNYYTNLQNTIVVNRLDSNKNIIGNDVNIINYYNKYKNYELFRKGIELIKKNLKSKHIVITSDYDADGISSASMCYRAFTKLFNIPNENISVIINKRVNGNSFNPILVEEILKANEAKPIDMLISFDQGSLNEKEYQILKDDTDMVIIITDHHQVDVDNYPHSVDAFINPQDPKNTDDELRLISGCTVGFLLIALTYIEVHNDYENLSMLYPYPAITVISDVMDTSCMLNRVIFNLGMKEINRNNECPINHVLENIGFNNLVKPDDITRTIAPFINTGNRCSVEDPVFNILAWNYDQVDMDSLAIVKKKLNERRDATKVILKDILNGKIKVYDVGILVTIIHTDLAIGGIIGSRLGEIYNKPVIVLHPSNDTYVASCRSIVKGFNILEFLQDVKTDTEEYWEKLGGHTEACGFTIKESGFDKVLECIKTKIDNNPNLLRVKDDIITIDGLIKIEDLDLQLVYEINMLQPYGKNFTRPNLLSIFYIDSIIILNSYNTVIIKFATKHKGREIKGFYPIGENPDITIDNIKEVLSTGRRCLVCYNLSYTTSSRVSYINLDIKKINII